jgi:hypothetical protein
MRGDEDTIESDAPDPFGGVYANVPKEDHTLKPVDNCEFCNAKKFEYEPPRFFCRSGDIHLSTPETPLDELVRLWTASGSDARHFRDHIRYFNGTSPSLLYTVILMVRPPTLGSVPYTPFVRMAPFTIILKLWQRK